MRVFKGSGISAECYTCARSQLTKVRIDEDLVVVNVIAYIKYGKALGIYSMKYTNGDILPVIKRPWI
ncbi:MAG: hypothetical protein M1113_02335 [Candidatus Thermoplasmatota archaeon]|nr:hypothetical protein [Candidatus Thermoplasmatota archaeon]